MFGILVNCLRTIYETRLNLSIIKALSTSFLNTNYLSLPLLETKYSCVYAKSSEKRRKNCKEDIEGKSAKDCWSAHEFWPSPGKTWTLTCQCDSDPFGRLWGVRGTKNYKSIFPTPQNTEIPVPVSTNQQNSTQNTASQSSRTHQKTEISQAPIKFPTTKN